MKRILLFLLVFLSVHISAYSHQNISSDKEIKHYLIEKYIRSYSGQCPCPYSQQKNGARCNEKSAYSRMHAQGADCFNKDISNNQLKAFREMNGIKNH